MSMEQVNVGRFRNLAFSDVRLHGLVSVFFDIEGGISADVLVQAEEVILSRNGSHNLDGGTVATFVEVCLNFERLEDSNVYVGVMMESKDEQYGDVELIDGIASPDECFQLGRIALPFARDALMEYFSALDIA